MKSFEEISNLTQGAYRRPGAKTSNNRTQPSAHAIDAPSIDKNSSKEMNQTQRLYVKEFFDHFFEKKSMLQIITQVSNAIHVLQSLVTNFQNQKGIISDSKMYFNGKITMNGSFSNVIEKQGSQISEAVEDLYHRLQAIFDQWKDEDKTLQASPKHFHAFTSECNGDEQLYEMLNDYKNENKKLKELKKKAETECIELRKQVCKLQDEKIKVNQLFKESELQLGSSNKKIDALESKISELNEQINTHINQKDQLSEKLTLLFQINQNMAIVEKQNEQLKEKLKDSQEREASLAKKFDSLDSIVKSKIKQKDDKWMAMIESKLTSKTLFENASCSAFRQFMSTVQLASK